MPTDGLMQMGMTTLGADSGFFMETAQLLDQSSPRLGTACAYIAAAAAAGIAWRALQTLEGRSITRGGVMRRRFWAVTSVLLILAALDRLTGLFASVAEVGRGIFGALDLYDQRGSWQIAAMAIIGLGALSVLGLGWARTRRVAVSGRLQRRDATTVIVLTGMGAWTACRVVSWHDFEALLVESVGALELGTVVEWVLIAAIVGCAAATIRWTSAHQRGSTSARLASS